MRTGTCRGSRSSSKFPETRAPSGTLRAPSGPWLYGHPHQENVARDQRIDSQEQPWTNRNKHARSLSLPPSLIIWCSEDRNSSNPIEWFTPSPSPDPPPREKDPDRTWSPTGWRNALHEQTSRSGMSCDDGDRELIGVNDLNHDWRHRKKKNLY